MKQLPTRPRHVATLTALLFIIPAFVARAQWVVPTQQSNPELFVTIQDTVTLPLIVGFADTIKANEVHAAYVFDMPYDSTSIVMYTFTECTRNGRRIKLANWIDYRTTNASDSALSSISTTDTFICHTSDTLSFYRELRWRDPRTGWSDTDSYYALDSLDYAVELVRASDSMRVALLDSIGMLSNNMPSRPVVHGMHPLMTLVRYIIPPSVNDTRTFIRVLVYHRGDGESNFTRNDWINIALSARLTDPIWTRFIELFKPDSSTIVAPNVERGSVSGW